MRFSLVTRLLGFALLVWTLVLVAVAPVLAAPGRQLIVGVIQGGWPPFSTVVNRRIEGLSAAFLSAALGTDPRTLSVITFRNQSALLRAACRGEVDVVPDLALTPEREACLIFSEPYYEGQAVTVAREGRPELTRPENGTTATYAVETGFLMADRLREQYPHAKFLYVSNTRQALAAVAAGRADLYVGLRSAVEYEIRESALRGLILFDAHAEPAGELHFAFPRDRAGLRDEIDAGLKRLAAPARVEILARWIAAGVTPPADAGRFALSDSERAFLVGLPALKVRLVGWRPYRYLDQAGQQVGILPDYLAYLSQQLGVRFNLQQLESATATERAQDLDALDVGVYAVPDDRDTLPQGAVRPIETYPVVVVGRRTDPTVSGIAQLAHRRIVVLARATNLELLRRDVPTAAPIAAQSIEDALRLVRDGKADVFVGNLAASDYLLQGEYAGDLKVLGPAGYEQAIGFQVRPGFEPLIPILNRALAAMPEAQRVAIRNRYLMTSYQLGPSWREIIRRSAPFVVLAGFSIIMLAFAYLRLRREIRRRQESEHQLQAQLEFQRTLIDAVPIPIAVKDRDGCYLAVNTAYLSAAGMTRQQMLTQLPTALNVLGNQAAKVLEEASSRAMNSREAQQFAVDFVDTDGNTRYFLCWAQPIGSAAATSAAVISAAVDVTDIRNAEEKARAAEALLVEVTRHLPATVFQMRERDDGFTYQWVSGNAQQLLGRAPDALIGQTNPMIGIAKPEDRERVLNAAEQAKAMQWPLSQDMRFVVGGETRWVRLHAVPRADADGSVLWSGYYTDLTEDRARAEALAQARDTAEAALRAKEGFLAMMSHEIRTPMNGIMGLIELLQATSLTSEQLHMVELARESGQSLGQILDDILDYAKIEAGRLSITASPLDLRELFDGVLGALLPKAFEKGLHLKQMVGAEVPAMVRSDGIRLRQILFNLLGNAIKFTERGIVALRAAVEARDYGRGTLVITVDDSGIGISREDIGRLFAPFVQSERSTTRRFGGTGLGLSISRRLAELMDGELTLRSEEGVGTTAILRVPCDVVTQQYDIPALRGRPLFAQVNDRLKREALLAFGSAAGMRCLDSCDSMSDGTVAIVDHRAHAVACSQVVCLSSELLPLGYREDDRGVWLANNPLRWTAFVAAVQATLHDTALVAEASVATAVTVATAMPEQGASILVVEDHAINRDVVQQQLRRLGYRTTACTNGKEALVLLDATAFDLVLTDCHMPVMDGFDLTRAIRDSGIASVSRMPVIGLTATIAREEHLLCTIVGMDAFLVKPATMSALQEAIEAALAGHAMAARSGATELPGDASSGDATSVPDGTVAEYVDVGALRSLLDEVLPGEAVRESFWQALHEDRAALLALIRAPSRQVLAAWCHRAGGALTALDQPGLRALVNRLDEQVCSGSLDDVRTTGQLLISMYDNLIDLLEEHVDS